jgi:hypothetical protein
MDIDAACKGRTLSDACCYCGSTRHWAKDFHLQFDVQHMDTDELQTILEDKLAAKDVILMELLVEEADEAPIYGEGFVSSSG